ncbi:unnamed protein product [Polarella glacialis]|uniref:Uncharacterized protein n=1 Tax=Polarella glacialis TaxID=89957 RepID=A0A813M604_POLGL|nr:unnamed protein product [Polarella glacialis]CAE8741780.1 unnamed protein product [Polarella glacialis]
MAVWVMSPDSGKGLATIVEDTTLELPLGAILLSVQRPLPQMKFQPHETTKAEMELAAIRVCRNMGVLGEPWPSELVAAVPLKPRYYDGSPQEHMRELCPFFVNSGTQVDAKKEAPAPVTLLTGGKKPEPSTGIVGGMDWNGRKGGAALAAIPQHDALWMRPQTGKPVYAHANDVILKPAGWPLGFVAEEDERHITIELHHGSRTSHASLLQIQGSANPKRAHASLSEIQAKHGTKQSGSPELIGKVFFINLARSIDRRKAMEDHLSGLPSMLFERFPAVEFQTTAPGSLEKANFTAHDLQLLQDIFGEWACGLWACAPSDVACCLGFHIALEATTHGFHVRGVAHHQSVRGTSHLGNLASHVAILKQIRAEAALEQPSLFVIAEDDVRLSPDWQKQVSDALPMLSGNWDVIKLSWHTAGFDEGKCPWQCSGNGQTCFLELTSSCALWSTGALLVNPHQAQKILTAIERVSKDMAMTRISGKRVDMHSYDIDSILYEATVKRVLRILAMKPAVSSVDVRFHTYSTFALPN